MQNFPHHSSLNGADEWVDTQNGMIIHNGKMAVVIEVDDVGQFIAMLGEWTDPRKG